jgi:CDP-diacylglycerol--glycerol-3-phosphate 3-phosphatidyltransferase
MIPVFCLLIYFYSLEREWLRWAALGVYALAAVSDFLDGYIARHWNQRTELGARLDPLADKLIINLGFVFLAANLEFQEHVPMWFPVVILGRDAVIVMGSYLLHEFIAPLRQVKPRMLGKFSTATQMAAMIGALIQVHFLDWLIALALLFTALSFVDYVYVKTRDAFRQRAADVQQS